VLRQTPTFFSILTIVKAAYDKRAGREQKFSRIYRKALVSKQTFSGIAKGKVPLKDTVFKLAFALEATVEDAEYLLECAGYSFGICIKRDLLLKSCFENGITNIFEVDEILEKERERLLLKDKRIKGQS